MPRGIDYIDICNMKYAELKGWLRSQEWVYPVSRKGNYDLPYRRGRKKFSGQELEAIWQGVERFRDIVLKWVGDEALTEEDKWTVIHEFANPKMGRTSTPYHPVSPKFSWPGDRLDDLEFGEIVVDDEYSLIFFSLYWDLYEDIQAVKRGERPKPQLCALGAEPDTRQEACGWLFRRKPGPGRQPRFCSETCRSTNSTRKALKEKQKQRLKNIPVGR